MRAVVNLTATRLCDGAWASRVIWEASDLWEAQSGECRNFEVRIKQKTCMGQTKPLGWTLSQTRKAPWSDSKHHCTNLFPAGAGETDSWDLVLALEDKRMKQKEIPLISPSHCVPLALLKESTWFEIVLSEKFFFQQRKGNSLPPGPPSNFIYYFIEVPFKAATYRDQTVSVGSTLECVLEE